MVTSLIFLNEMPYINTHKFLSLLNLKTTIKKMLNLIRIIDESGLT